MKFKEEGTEGIKRFIEDKAYTRARMIWLLPPPSPLPLYPRQLTEAEWQPSLLSCLMSLLSFKGRDFACVSTVGGGVEPILMQQKYLIISQYSTVQYSS